MAEEWRFWGFKAGHRKQSGHGNGVEAERKKKTTKSQLPPAVALGGVGYKVTTPCPSIGFGGFIT